MIGYALRRPSGGRRYTPADRATARALANALAPFTLSAEARAAMVDPLGIRVFAEATFEVESNRLRRPTDHRFLVDGVEVAGADAPNVDLASTRFNPTGVYAVADVATADSGFEAWPDTAAADTEVAAVVGTVKAKANPANGDASSTPAAGVRGEWRIGGLTDADPSYLLTRSAAAGDAGRVATDEDAAVLVAAHTGPLYASGRRVIRPGVATTTRYAIPTGGTRRFTVAARVAVNVATEVTPRLVVTVDGVTTTLDGTATLVDPATSLVRVSSTFEVAGDPGDLVTRVEARLLLGDTAATRVEFRDVTAYAGEDRGDLTFDGVRPIASTLSSDVVIEASWSDGTRRISRVDLSGDLRAGAITSASVDVQTAAGGPWTPVGTSSTGAGNRLAIDLGDEYDTHGIRVHVEETTAGEDGPVFVTEVDPRLVRDVTDEVESLTVEWSRETDPGSVSSPVGNYEASTVNLTLDNSGGAWNPHANASLDVGHEITVAVGVTYSTDDGDVDEVLPAGVFYSEPFDTDSDAVTVSIRGVDRLARDSAIEIREPLALDVRLDDLVRDLVLRYLDLDADQVFLPTAAVNETTFPYAYPDGTTLGTYLADLAKATDATLYVDPYDRLVIAGRAETLNAEPVEEIRDDNALISYRTPPGYDTTASIVTVNASPLGLGEVAELWKVPDDGLDVPEEGTTIVAFYGTQPALNVYVEGLTAAEGSPALTVTATRFYAGMAEIDVAAAGPAGRLAALSVMGQPLEEQPLTVTMEDPASVARYGRRELTIDARLIQTEGRLRSTAGTLLAAFRALDDDGVRRLPDLELSSLGLLHVEAGDVVTVAHAGRGLGGGYVVLGRTLDYAGGAILSNAVRVRQADTTPYAIADASLADDGRVAAY